MTTQFVKCFQITDCLRDIGNWDIEFIPTIYALGFWKEQFSFIHIFSEINLLDVFSGPNRCSFDFRLLTPVDLPWCCDIYLHKKYGKDGLPLDYPKEYVFKKNIMCREEAAHAIFLAHQKILNQVQDSDSPSDSSLNDDRLTFSCDTVCIKVIGCQFDFSFVALPPFPYSSSKVSEQLDKHSISVIQDDNALPIFPLVYANDESTKFIFSRLGQENTSKGIAVIVKRSDSFNSGEYRFWDSRLFKNIYMISEFRSGQPIASSPDYSPNPYGLIDSGAPYATLVKHICLEFVHKFEAAIPLIHMAIESTIEQLERECGLYSSFKMNLENLINNFSNAFNDALANNDEEGVATRVQQHLNVLFTSLSKTSPMLFIKSAESEDDVPFTLVAPLDMSKYWHFTSDEIDSHDETTHASGFFAGMLPATPLGLVKTCQQNWDLDAMAFFEVVKAEIEALIDEITDEVVGQFPDLYRKFNTSGKSLVSSLMPEINQQIDYLTENERTCPLICNGEYFAHNVEYVAQLLSSNVVNLDLRTVTLLSSSIAYYDIACRRFCENIATLAYKGLIQKVQNSLHEHLLDHFGLFNRGDPETHLRSSDTSLTLFEATRKHAMKENFVRVKSLLKDFLADHRYPAHDLPA